MKVIQILIFLALAAFIITGGAIMFTVAGPVVAVLIVLGLIIAFLFGRK